MLGYNKDGKNSCSHGPSILVVETDCKYLLKIYIFNIVPSVWKEIEYLQENNREKN